MDRYKYIEQLNIWKKEKITEFKDIDSDNYNDRFTFLRCNRHKFVLPDQLNTYSEEDFYKEVIINKYWAEKEYTTDYCYQNSKLDVKDNNILCALKEQCIVTTFHIGSFFSIINAVIKVNPNICVVIDDKTYKNKIKDIKEISNRFYLDIEVINIETLDGFNILLESIDKGASLCFFIDGNSGIHGVNDKQNKLEIPFFSSSIQVKTGIPSISYMFNLPIIQLFTIRDDNRENIYFSKGMIVPTKDIGKTSYISTSINLIWNNFIEVLKKYPTQWEGWLYLHRFHLKFPYYTAHDNVDAKKYILNPMFSLYNDKQQFYVYSYIDEMRFIVSEYIYKILWKLRINNAYLTLDKLNRFIQDIHIRNILIENSVLIHPNAVNI